MIDFLVFERRECSAPIFRNLDMVPTELAVRIIDQRFESLMSCKLPFAP